ncbi:MAG: hypothetical protein KTR14_09280 [Vampirovibrio sp.]|nr:hypothetical protein [Vampirovibrio sp.]
MPQIQFLPFLRQPHSTQLTYGPQSSGLYKSDSPQREVRFSSVEKTSGSVEAEEASDFTTIAEEPANFTDEKSVNSDTTSDMAKKANRTLIWSSIFTAIGILMTATSVLSVIGIPMVLAGAVGIVWGMFKKDTAKTSEPDPFTLDNLNLDEQQVSEADEDAKDLAQGDNTKPSAVSKLVEEGKALLQPIVELKMENQPPALKNIHTLSLNVLKYLEASHFDPEEIETYNLLADSIQTLKTLIPVENSDSPQVFMKDLKSSAKKLTPHIEKIRRQLEQHVMSVFLTQNRLLQELGDIRHYIPIDSLVENADSFQEVLMDADELVLENLEDRVRLEFFEALELIEDTKLDVDLRERHHAYQKELDQQPKDDQRQEITQRYLEQIRPYVKSVQNLIDQMEKYQLKKQIKDFDRAQRFDPIDMRRVLQENKWLVMNKAHQRVLEQILNLRDEQLETLTISEKAQMITHQDMLTSHQAEAAKALKSYNIKMNQLNQRLFKFGVRKARQEREKNLEPTGKAAENIIGILKPLLSPTEKTAVAKHLTSTGKSTS